MGLPVQLEKVASDECEDLVFRNTLFNTEGESEKTFSQVHFSMYADL